MLALLRLALILGLVVTLGAPLNGDSSVFARQQTPQPDGRDDDHQLPAITLPLLAYFIAPCLSSEAEAPVAAAIRDQVARELPEAHVRAKCSLDIERIAVWERDPRTDEEATAYQRGFFSPRINVLEGSETFGVYISRAIISLLADRAWEQFPKRYNLSGQEDPFGAVHLNDLGFRLVAPDRVITVVDGQAVLNNLPNPDFTINTHETLSVEAGSVACHLEATLFDPEGFAQVIFTALAVISTLTFTTLFDPGGDLPEDAAVGCRAAAELPRQIELDGGVQVELTYTRVAVEQRGVVGAGTYTFG